MTNQPSTSVVKSAVAILLVLLLPCGAYACGPGEQQVFICQTTKNKVVKVCSAGANATYSYGRPGMKPELSLRQPKHKLRYERYIGSGGGSEHLTFRNGNTAYQVINSVTFGRTYGDGHTTQYDESGEITVNANNRQIASIECKDGSMKSDFGVLGMEPASD